MVGATIQQKIWDLDPNWWAVRTGFQPLPKVERMIFLPGMNEITMAQMLVTNETKRRRLAHSATSIPSAILLLLIEDRNEP